MKIRCFTTEPHYQEWLKKTEAFTILSSQIKTKNYSFYNFNTDKTKLKLLLWARKYKHWYMYLCFIQCTQSLTMAGKNGQNVEVLNTIKVLCWMEDIRNLSILMLTNILEKHAACIFRVMELCPQRWWSGQPYLHRTLGMQLIGTS
jgi:hypothetical protein